MFTERRKVLELLAEGKITAEEADKLLEKLASVGGANSAPDSGGTASKPGDAKPFRYIRVLVEKPDGQNVNMRIPLSFARSGLGVILSRHVLDKLSESGIDVNSFSGLRGKDLDEALQQLNIDVDESSGKKVRIFCE